MRQAADSTGELPSRVQAWCNWQSGGGRVLIIAPHGGVRSHGPYPAIPKRGDRAWRINDLHSADLATQLAGALDAGWVVNRGMDRNRLDLNRISQVRKRAPWFLEIIARMASDIVDRHGEVHLLVVHGWNVNNGGCDLGVGADVSDPAGPTDALTVSSPFLQRYLRSLCSSDDPGLRFTLGRRYPAGHRNNLLQLFRADGSRSAELPRRLAEIVRAGRCEAVQLEIGAPLRWPGPRRERFIDRITETFTAPPAMPPAPGAAAPATAARPLRSAAAPSCDTGALQAFDTTSQVAILASVDRLPPAGPVFGRVALFLPDGRVALYTGEADTPVQLGDDGPSFTTAGDATELRFTGAFLIAPNGDDYVDLERALTHSELAHGTASLSYTADRDHDGSGRVVGSVSVADRSFAIDTVGFATPRQWGAWRRAERSQWSVRVAFPGGRSTVLHSAPRRPGRPAVECARILLGAGTGGVADPYAPAQLAITVGQRTLVATPLSRMSIARPVGPMRRARVSFGPAAIREVGTDARGFGIYEYARLIDR